MASDTKKWYDQQKRKDPEAYKSGRLAQQKRYQKTPKGRAINDNANRLNRKLGTYGNVDGLDASHYNGSTTDGRLQKASENRRSRLKAKKSTKGN